MNLSCFPFSPGDPIIPLFSFFDVILSSLILSLSFLSSRPGWTERAWWTCLTSVDFRLAELQSILLHQLVDFTQGIR